MQSCWFSKDGTFLVSQEEEMYLLFTRNVMIPELMSKDTLLRKETSHAVAHEGLNLPIRPG